MSTTSMLKFLIGLFVVRTGTAGHYRYDDAQINNVTTPFKQSFRFGFLFSFRKKKKKQFFILGHGDKVRSGAPRISATVPHCRCLNVSLRDPLCPGFGCRWCRFLLFAQTSRARTAPHAMTSFWKRDKTGTASDLSGIRGVCRIVFDKA